MKPKQKSYSPSPPQFRRNTSTRKPINPVRCPPILDQQKKQKTKNKSVQIATRKRKVSLQIKTKFKISSQHMGFLIEQQKTNDLAIINSSVALNHYYQSLLSLFSAIYSASQIITSNLLEIKKQTLGLSGVKFIGIVFKIYQYVWNQNNIARIKIMARNVMKMGCTANLFQQKIAFVCRKITLNFNMRKRIEMSFLNIKLSSFWQNLIKKIKFSDQVQMLQDLYQTAPQKMAYWDFSYFVNNYLADQRFYELIKQSNKYRRIQNMQEDTLPHNFTYEFFIIQLFCFHQQQISRQQNQEDNKMQMQTQQKNCQII